MPEPTPAAPPTGADDRVPMVGPDGSRKMVPAALAPHFEKAGARRASPQEVQAYRASRTAGSTYPSSAGTQPQMTEPMSGLGSDRVPNDLAYQLIAQTVKERNAEQARVATERRTTVPVSEELLKNYPKVAKMGYQAGDVIPQSVFDAMAGQTNKGASLGLRDEQFREKQFAAMGKDLDPSGPRAGAFGVSKQVFDRAERLQSLASAFKDGDLDSRQIEEMAIGLNAMLSGANTGAQEQVKALVPRTIMGNAQKFTEWLTNEPRGTNQQAFVKRMLGSIEREKSTASDQIKRVQMQRAASRYAHLEKSDPEGFYESLRGAGVEPDDYKKWKKGGMKPASAVQKPEEGKKGGGDDLDALIDKHLGGK